MNNCFFISEGAFTFKVEGTGVLTRGFFVSGGREVNNNNNFITSTDNNNNIYVGLTSTTRSRRLTMRLSDTSSIAQHLKNIHVQQHNYEKFSLTTQQY